MKLRYIALLLIAGIVLFSSCSKEEVDPRVEMFVHTMESEQWDSATFRVGNIRWATEDESGNYGWAGFYQYEGYNTAVSLEETSTRMIFDGYHFDIELLAGLKLVLNNVKVMKDGVEQTLYIPPFDFNELIVRCAIENGKHYRFDFTIDFDKLVYEEGGIMKLNPDYRLDVELL